MILLTLRGHNDNETRSTFTWVQGLQGVPISSVYSGGHHTWALVDNVGAFESKNSRPPSPLMQLTPRRNRNSSAEQRTNEKPDGYRKGVLLAENQLNIVFSDQKMSHRFIRVSVQSQKLKAFNAELIDYIKRLEEEDPGLIYYNVQEDGAMFNMVSLAQFPKSTKLWSYFLAGIP